MAFSATKLFAKNGSKIGHFFKIRKENGSKIGHFKIFCELTMLKNVVISWVFSMLLHIPWFCFVCAFSAFSALLPFFLPSPLVIVSYSVVRMSRSGCMIVYMCTPVSNTFRLCTLHWVWYDVLGGFPRFGYGFRFVDVLFCFVVLCVIYVLLLYWCVCGSLLCCVCLWGGCETT